MTHRILIVDDDLHIREVIRVALKKAGMTFVGPYCWLGPPFRDAVAELESSKA